MPPPEMFSVVVSPPIGSSMPCTLIGRIGVDARPLAALDPLGLAVRDDAQLLGAAVVDCRMPAKRWMPRPVLYSTATSPPACRLTRGSLTVSTSTIAPGSTFVDGAPEAGRRAAG